MQAPLRCQGSAFLYAFAARQPPPHDFFAVQGGNTSWDGKINQSGVIE